MEKCHFLVAINTRLGAKTPQSTWIDWERPEDASCPWVFSEKDLFELHQFILREVFKQQTAKSSVISHISTSGGRAQGSVVNYY